jgi:hypothetical protein
MWLIHMLRTLAIVHTEGFMNRKLTGHAITTDCHQLTLPYRHNCCCTHFESRTDQRCHVPHLWWAMPLWRGFPVVTCSDMRIFHDLNCHELGWNVSGHGLCKFSGEILGPCEILGFRGDEDSELKPSRLWPPCSVAVGYQRFGVARYLHLHGKWWCRRHGPPKRRYPTTTLHGVTTEKASTWVRYMFM